jgi:hypothetical protein
MQTCIWLLAEYANSLELLKRIFDLIMKNLGDLNFELLEANSLDIAKDSTSTTEKKYITKTVVLPDGTYSTETILIDPTEHNKQKDSKYLRNFILETNFFFSTNLVLSITRILNNMLRFDTTETKEIFKTYYFNTINIICSLLKMNSYKIYKDPDNVSRITMCLEFLLNGDFDNFNLWINEIREIYNNYYINQMNSKKTVSNVQNTNTIIQPDEFISFRHVKPFDPENLDVIEDDVVNTAENKKILEESNKNNKFTEMLTGSEDPLHVEAVVEIFTFDIVIEFFIKNKTKSDLQNITIELFAPTNLEIIEHAPQISLAANEAKTVRSCIKFSTTCNSFIFGQVNYANSKGALNSINLSGIFIDLLVNIYL